MKTSILRGIVLLLLIAAFLPGWTDQYFALSKKTGDTYYILPDSKVLKFSFFEEYTPPANSLLNYQVFDNKRVQKTGLPALPAAYGFSKYSLNLSDAELTAGEYYMLEVSNQKNEKWFLRFKVQ